MPTRGRRRCGHGPAGPTIQRVRWMRMCFVLADVMYVCSRLRVTRFPPRPAFHSTQSNLANWVGRGLNSYILLSRHPVQPRSRRQAPPHTQSPLDSRIHRAAHHRRSLHFCHTQLTCTTAASIHNRPRADSCWQSPLRAFLPLRSQVRFSLPPALCLPLSSS